VITFDPHPLKLLAPGALRAPSHPPSKLALIESAGIDAFSLLPSTSARRR
jgi:FAD synthase